VRPLVDANRRMAGGDFGARAEVSSADELGELADGFNAMADRLQAEQQHLEAQVAERTAQLVQLAEARAEVLAAISHDFRTPIFAIMRHAELMTSDDFTPPDDRWVARFGATILDSSQLLLDRVGEILDLAKTGAVGLELERRPCRLHELLDGLEGPAAAIARAAGVELHIVRGPADGVVDGDPKRLRQALLNLVSNAVKYSRTDGRVTVRGSVTDTFVEVAVIDAGVGIPAEAAQLVFEPFYRVPGVEATDGQPSSGLGLAVVKRVVDAHGGTIRVTSEVGAGSTFVISLPRIATRTKRRRTLVRQ
jgi:signal transduction histidine kinase